MEIKKICVLGPGLMDSGIAQVSAGTGYRVSVQDVEDRFVEWASILSRRILIEQSAKGR